MISVGFQEGGRGFSVTFRGCGGWKRARRVGWVLDFGGFTTKQKEIRDEHAAL